jgi:NAD(P)-dependent dehydrogenase (short-subunit alcohol dehydrogenase family)/rhamnose utilization protein RhaD (predicted bifunctional aldolase and dehydrogenase)
MEKAIRDLIDISRYYGRQKEYTLAGGGNTSYKNRELIWVKASGASLADIDEDGFAVLYRDKVKITGVKRYSDNAQIRETEVRTDLEAAIVDVSRLKRPSVETSFHEIIEYAFVVHTHPTLTNALMCSVNARLATLELFGEEAMYLPYAPGYALFKLLQAELQRYRKKFSQDPHLIFLENHGIFVSADTPEEIKALYNHVTGTIRARLHKEADLAAKAIPENITQFLPGMRMMLMKEGKAPVVKTRHNSLHAHFYASRSAFAKASLPFTPDIIVYCKGHYLYIDEISDPASILSAFSKKLEQFRKDYSYDPKLVMIKNYGIVAFEESAQAANTALEVYEDLLKISFYSENFGGPHFLSDEEIAFVDNWEVENYRRKISKGQGAGSPVDQKIIVITGGAQGFGGGLAEMLATDGANLVIADLNDAAGMAKKEELQAKCRRNEVVFIQTDVSDAASVAGMVTETVKNFGGIDVFISNAGILRAGGIDEMEPETFRLMTRVNYEAYFLCTKYAGAVMKLQSEYSHDTFFDIIQVNSKSGLRGSNKNFAYAGGKFGGIGLTESFALELAPFRIKVNSICPGNFFEGPLWADPENGLFVQYLRAGKVPGARTIEDVKRFYEQQVPMGRGCRVEDILKAIYYVIGQNYETGQALPVTGGQVMLR